ncbi:terminase small subunit [Clostridium botulinum]|uniref:terminase small subunit n=1 Tax=Clostridium botulinum TaxID=1491 RepID=UPI00249DED1B|nr:terminase small subunit [Clostridium botulinum]WGZ48095.1 phage portal protein [Clostridium botulinum]
MSRVRSPDRDRAFEIYKEHKGNIDLVKIAEILDIPAGTIRGWKNKDKWEYKLNGTFQKNSKKNTERSNKKNKTKKKPIVEEVEHVLSNADLTDKQRLFCVYYIKYFNATKAYQKAYSSSYSVANVEGYRLLVNPSVKKEIENLKKAKLNRAMLSPDDIFQKYIDIAFSDISDFVTFGQKELPVLNPVTGEQILDELGEVVTYTVNYVDFKESSDVDGTIIDSVSKGKDGVRLKLQDKMKALQWLSERMDLLPTETRMRLDNERVKVEIAKEKLELEKGKANKETLDNELKIVIDYGDENGNS